MGKSVLLLRLEGPLQSWGSRSRWDVRDTSPEPTKSGVIGLLGCALGLRRGDGRLEELDKTLRFGVRVEHAGRRMVDYQTVTDFLPMAMGGFKGRGTSGKFLSDLQSSADATPSTIISPRAYLEDAAFLAGLEAWDDSSGLLQECAQALQRPYWPLFLGRKACAPTRPILDCLAHDYAGVEDALSRYPWSWLGAGRFDRDEPAPEHLHGWLEVTGEATGPDVALRQDALRLNAARAYDFRAARRMTWPFPGVSFPLEPTTRGVA